MGEASREGAMTVPRRSIDRHLRHFARGPSDRNRAPMVVDGTRRRHTRAHVLMAG